MTDIQIAQAAKKENIVEIADALKIMEELWFYLLPTEYGLNSVKLFYDGIKNYYSNK